MDFKNLMDVFRDQIKDIYNAEKQLAETLPFLVSAATETELKQIFQERQELTRNHQVQLQQILKLLDAADEMKRCYAMEGLVNEAMQIVNRMGDPDALDAGLIAAAQKIEHYAIATYGTLRTWAWTLGENEYGEVLQEILDEAHDTNYNLTRLAQDHLNRDAVR